jgi:hypothetical protein
MSDQRTWGSAVRRGYVALGVGIAAIIGAIPTENLIGYVLGAAGIVLGGIAWFRTR